MNNNSIQPPQLEPVKSKKRLAREAKEMKKLQNIRTKEERQAEIDKIFAKLDELRIPRNMLSEFNKISIDYVENAVSFSGSVKLPELNRKLIYSLPCDKRIPVGAMLQAI